MEPINTFDIPASSSRTQHALELIEQVAAPNLYVQYDIYHMQRMEGEIAATLKTHLPKIKHVQLADNPGRNEPGTGELNYRFLFQWLDAIGYTGWVGCEYKPKTTTEAGLGWRGSMGCCEFPPMAVRRSVSLGQGWRFAPSSFAMRERSQDVVLGAPDWRNVFAFN